MADRSRPDPSASPEGAGDAPATGPGAEPLVHESTKHGAQTDDRLAAGDVRFESDAGTPDVPGEPATPELRARPSPVDDVSEGPMERELRAEILRLVSDAHFPATRNDLLRHIGPDERGPAQGHLRALPPDLVFSSPEEVATAFGGIRSSD